MIIKQAQTALLQTLYRLQANHEELIREVWRAEAMIDRVKKQLAKTGYEFDNTKGGVEND